MGWSLNITGTPPSFCGWISPLSDTPKWGFGPQNQGVLHQWIGSRENFSIGNHWTPSISFPSFFVGFSPGISHPILISLKLSMMESIGWLRFIQLSNRWVVLVVDSTFSHTFYHQRWRCVLFEVMGPTKSGERGPYSKATSWTYDEQWCGSFSPPETQGGTHSN